MDKYITAIDGFNLRFNGTHFNELVVKYSNDVTKLNKRLLQRNIQGGLVLDEFYPELKNCILLGVSEAHSDEDIEKFALSLKEVSYV